MFNRLFKSTTTKTSTVKASGSGAMAAGGSITSVTGNRNNVAGSGASGNYFSGSSYSSSGSSVVQINNGNIVITCAKIVSITINGKNYNIE
jgi:hypothetical protein